MTDDTPGEWSGSGEFNGVSERLEEPASDDGDMNVPEERSAVEGLKDFLTSDSTDSAGPRRGNNGDRRRGRGRGVKESFRKLRYRTNIGRYVKGWMWLVLGVVAVSGVIFMLGGTVTGQFTSIFSAVLSLIGMVIGGFVVIVVFGGLLYVLGTIVPGTSATEVLGTFIALTALGVFVTVVDYKPVVRSMLDGASSHPALIWGLGLLAAIGVGKVIRMRMRMMR